MSKEQFYKDLEVATKTELEIAELFKQTYNAEIVEWRHDNQYDLKIKIVDRVYTIEIKEDFKSAETSNLSIEYSCRGKNSGIMVTKADFYLIKAYVTTSTFKYLMIPVKTIKRLILDKQYIRKVNGGDIGSNSLSFLFRREKIQQYAYELFKKTLS